MDRFDEFIKNKAIEDDESFILPKSFEDKIESVLENIDVNEKANKNVRYNSKRLIGMAAGFVLCCLLLIKFILTEEHMDGSVLKSSGSEEISRSADAPLEASSAEILDKKDSVSTAEVYSMDSNITLSLFTDNNNIEGINGQDMQFGGEILDGSSLSGNLPSMTVVKDEEIKITFSEEPSSYEVNLVQDSSDNTTSNEDTKLIEYPSENYMIKAPTDSGIYTFEIIGRWDAKTIEYTIEIQVES